MTTTSVDMPDAIAAHRLPATAGKANFAGALRSEFTKIRSVRSTYWSLFALAVITIGIGALASWGATKHGMRGPNFDPTMQSLGGLYLSQLVIGVLGVIVITSEYSTGMIRTTLTTMPRRGTMIAAKAIVFALVTFVTGLITCFVSFFVGQALMSGHHRFAIGTNGPVPTSVALNTTLSQPHVLRAVIGGALFLTVCGLIAFGIGLLVRHTAGGITIVVALLFVISILVNLLPQSWQNDVDKWIPGQAGAQIWTTVPSQGTPALFAPWNGFAVFCGYAAIALIAGLYFFHKRDA